MEQACARMHSLVHAYPMLASAEHKALWPGFLVRLFLAFFLCPFLDLSTTYSEVAGNRDYHTTCFDIDSSCYSKND